MKQSQGTRANVSGRFAENIIDSTLRLRGYYPIRQYRVGVSIFKTSLVADFYLASVPNFPNGLVIESKRQETAGTVDEKVCFLVENIRSGCYPCPVIILVGGRGARGGSVDWLRAQVDGFRLFAVLDMDGFVSWCNLNL